MLMNLLTYVAYQEIQDEIEILDNTQDVDGVTMEERYFEIRAKLKRKK